MHLQQREDEWKEITEANRFEDPLDFTVRFIMIRGPTVYIMINMTLLIWLVQIMLSSNLDDAPQSLYLFAPLIGVKPINDIQVLSNNSTIGKCNQNYQLANLKVLPTINNQNLHISRTNLTFWRNQIRFCVRRLQNATRVQEKNCSISTGKVFCSQYCVDHVDLCPITSVSKVANRLPDTYVFDDDQNQELRNTDQIKKKHNVTRKRIFAMVPFYPSPDGEWQYVFSRASALGRPITSLVTAFSTLCANDFKVDRSFNSSQEFWSDTRNCSKEGTLNGILDIFDKTTSKDFFKNNHIPQYNQLFQMNPYQESLPIEQIYLGSIQRIMFDSKNPKCRQLQINVEKFSNSIIGVMIAKIPKTFKDTILVSCFVLFVACWLWLIGYYCFEGLVKQKNVIVILLAIIQLIVVGYMYYTNQTLFRVSQNLRQVASCIDSNIKAAEQWNYGIQSDKPFLMVIFGCIVFLGLQFVAFLVDRLMYVTQ